MYIVERGIVLIKSSGAQLLVQPGIPAYLTSFLACETEGLCIRITRGIRGANGGHIERQQVGVSNGGFYLLHIGAHLPNAKRLEVELFKYRYRGRIDKVALIGKVRVAEQKVRLMHKDLMNVLLTFTKLFLVVKVEQRIYV